MGVWCYARVVRLQARVAKGRLINGLASAWESLNPTPSPGVWVDFGCGIGAPAFRRHSRFRAWSFMGLGFRAFMTITFMIFTPA